MVLSLDDQLGKFPNACCDRYGGLGIVIPQKHRAIAMAKKEISVNIYSDNACLFASPPRRIKRSPIVFTKQDCHCQVTPAGERNASAPKERCPNFLKSID
ncbi:hypothetical protein [Massilia scottii]|uniref:hypothetical protein n=1 Tax=Massilia scottii TaxID=3057166 RepID=UPI00279645FA|nr:hypothetical protein [Massilia sp. CCM 9029]MDQ1832546.1 hypothetical protein [Massilia sp. CCM 9029]